MEGRGEVGFGRVEREGGRKKMENEGEKKRSTRKEPSAGGTGVPPGTGTSCQIAGQFFFIIFFIYGRGTQRAPWHGHERACSELARACP